VRRLLAVLALGGGAGLLPVAPGTAGALLGALLWLPCRENPALQLALLAFWVLAGWAACVEGERRWGHDPGRVVVDEIAGQWLALVLAQPAGWVGWLLAFGLFRLFDIWKPSLVDRLQRLPGAWGVMADDLLAGLLAGALVLGGRLLFGA
jgi:phosphatidylglycerophosphatase A